MKKIITISFLTFLTNFCFALKPDKTYKTTPDSLGLNYTKQVIKTDDNARLNAWIINPPEAQNNGTTIILSYGDAGNMSYWLNQAAILSQLDFTIVLFDYRGFGESSDFEMNPEQLYYNEFATDLETVIKWTKQNLKFKKLGILGLSMGTIMTTIAVQNEKVDFIIGEGFVLNPNEIKEKLFKFKQKNIILPENSDNYVDLIPKIEAPMLLFSGTLDNFTTVEDSKHVVKQKPNRKLVEFTGNHLEGFAVLSGEYFGSKYIQAMNEFLRSIQ
jgi:pimeloyl-ACP methyl ester carboxylesterase